MGNLSRLAQKIKNWAKRKPEAPKTKAEKPIEETRKYKRRHKIKVRFSISGNRAVLDLSNTEYKITPKGWRRITPRPSNKRDRILARRAKRLAA